MVARLTLSILCSSGALLSSFVFDLSARAFARLKRNMSAVKGHASAAATDFASVCKLREPCAFWLRKRDTPKGAAVAR